jgi:acetyl esterase/lipase
VVADPRTVLSRPAPPPDLRVAYGEHPDQVADLRFPPVPAPRRPLIIVVHGGFWRADYDRSHTGPMAADLAARGYPVAQLEYRRTGQSGGGWPGTLEDVSAGIAALPALAARASPLHNAPAGPPILLGHSAGGHLALWYAAARSATPLGGVVALAPVCDLVEAYRLDLDRGAVAALLGGSPDELPDRYADADPAQHPATAVTTVVVHGVLDEQVPIGLSRGYVSRARAAGADVRLVELPAVEHFGLIDPSAPAWTTVTDVLITLHP